MVVEVQSFGLIIASIGVEFKIHVFKGTSKMRSLKNTFLFFVTVVSFLAINANAGIINPQFEEGDHGWYNVSSTGSLDFSAGFAKFTGGDADSPYSAALIQGDDLTFSFNSPLLVSASAQNFEFDLWLLKKSNDATESGDSIFADSFFLALYDSADSAFDLTFNDLDFSTGGKFSFDISSLAGRSIAIYFELRDENDGLNLEIGLDNLQITERTSVSESSSFFLIFVGLFSLWYCRRR